MKFHCDRCKTRYSIADERVRGKILKIRCKNCSTVITVKEADGASPPRTPRDAGDSARSRAARRTGGRSRAASTSSSALQGAFEQALRRPRTAADSMTDAPAVLDAEWYVSQDGEQFGPFPLQKAQDWVSLRPADEELYCWSEGFDDWLPVEKVSHFRGLRGQAMTSRQSSGLLALNRERAISVAPSDIEGGYGGMPAHEDTPVPLFAATLAQVVADSEPGNRDNGEVSPVSRTGRRNGSSVSSLGLPASRPPSPATGAPGTGSLFAGALSAAQASGKNATGETHDDPSHDLEIGEASRVVKLPMLARNMGGAAPLGAPGLPGVAGPGTGPLGRGTGSHDQPGSGLAGLPLIHGGPSVDVPRPEILQPTVPRRRSGMAMPIAIGSAVVIGVVSVLLYVALAGEDEDAMLRRGQVGGKGGLAYQFDDEDGDGDKKGGDKATAGSGKSSGKRVARKSSSGGRSSTGAASASSRISVGPDQDEVDLSGSGGPARELDGDDVFDVYTANRIGVQMCYNNALKRDPLLSVRRADVAITVSTSGSVSSVSIPSLSGTPLGLCLEKRIRAWRFPRSTQVFSSQFPIVFQT
jgi:predicted Zn finger-like uncharacterized protein